MATIYELWDFTTGNLVGTYASTAAALDAVATRSSVMASSRSTHYS